MKKRIFLFALCLPSLFLGAEGLRVTVEDRELGIPLEGVSVSLSGSDSPVETDADGKATIERPQSFTKGTLATRLPGYADERVPVTAKDTEIVVKLTIAEVLEGAELVVERSVPGKTDEKPGVSVVMDSKEMETTARIGLVEDVMSAIATLPGVGFTGGFNAQPSIRGGYPSEMGTVLDDVYILQPFHWGGAYSIFNPNMVKTAKMSHGIFSARYGRAMSGLLEVTTIDPEKSKPRVEASVTSIATDFFAQVPINPKAGVFFGGKVTYLETLAWLNDGLKLTDVNLSETIPTMPFIRDFYAKGYVEPTPDFSVTMNGFFGSDGIGTSGDTTNDGVRTTSDFNWLNLQGFAAANVKWMPTANSAIRFLGAYNNNTFDIDMKSNISGTWKYSDEFMKKYDGSFFDTDATAGTFQGKTGYTLDNVGSNGFSENVIHMVQGKLEADILVFGSNVLTFGVDEVAQAVNSSQKMTGWQLVAKDDYFEYKDYTATLNVDGNRVLNSSAFALWSFGEEQGAFKGELGIRGEHFYLWNDVFKLNTYPVASPRLNLSWAPIRGSGPIDRLTLTAGTGLFSMFPIESVVANKDLGVESFSLGPNRAWFQVLGAEAEFAEDWSFRLEGYYKYYYNRLYLVETLNDATGKVDLGVKDDGIGYATGYDLMLRKKTGRKLDGYLSYSFVVAKYKNPAEPKKKDDTTSDGEPLGMWYYPSFHRFHTLNLVLNWKPVTGLVVTTTASLATGTPKEAVGSITMYPVLYKGTIIERYSRTSKYDDSLRTEISCPIDVRVGYSNYYRNSKVRWEYYIGAEDVLINLYSPKANSSFDPFTGKEIKGSDQADFGIGIPMFSVGYKVSY